MPYYDLSSDRYDFDTNISVEDIKTFFRKHRNSGPFFSMFETGLNGLRFDLIRIDPFRRYIRIFEFKSSRNDFVSDKKWQKYLNYCHTFTFACPREIIQKEDLPAGIGLMWIYKWKHKSRPWSNNWMLDAEWIKKPKAKDIEDSIISDVAFTLVYHAKQRSKEDLF